MGMLDVWLMCTIILSPYYIYCLYCAMVPIYIQYCVCPYIVPASRVVWTVVQERMT